MANTRTLKTAGIALAVAAAVAAAGIAYLASRFDAPRIKAELARLVQQEKQRTLAIDGELELSFWPSLGVRLEKLRLSEHASAEEFAHVDKAHVSVAVLPLLSGQIVVDAVAIDGAKATLIRRKDGTLNIDDLLAKDKAAAPRRIDIAAIKIGNVALDWHDEQTGERMSLAGLDLATGRVEGDTGTKTFSIDKLSLAAKGRLAAGAVEVKLKAPKLAAAPGGSSAGVVTLDAIFDGAPGKATLKLTAADIAGSGDALTVGKLAAQLEAKAGEASVTGKLEAPLRIDLGRRSIALDQIGGELELADARLPIKRVKLPLAASLRADLAKKSADGRLQTRLIDSNIALKFDVRRFAPLALGFALDIDRLDLDKLLPPKKVGAGAGDGKKEAAGKLDFSALKGLNLDGTINIGSLRLANVEATQVRLQVKGAAGRLELAPHSARVYGGRLDGALALDANGNAVALRENLAGIDIRPLLKDALDKDVLEGRGNVAVDVASRGDTAAAMKKALSGSAALTLRDGALKGINLAKSLRELKAKFSSRQDAVQQAKATEKTDFSELAATFKIAGGVAHNDDLVLKSPFLRVTGAGDIDIGGGTLDYLAQVSVVATAAGQGAPELEHLRGLTVPVRAHGPLDAPAYRIEFAALAREAAKAKVEEKAGAIKRQVQEKMQERLKGLLGK